jgi:hypothetical protein
VKISENRQINEYIFFLNKELAKANLFRDRGGTLAASRLESHPPGRGFRVKAESRKLRNTL